MRILTEEHHARQLAELETRDDLPEKRRRAMIEAHDAALFAIRLGRSHGLKGPGTWKIVLCHGERALAAELKSNHLNEWWEISTLDRKCVGRATVNRLAHRLLRDLDLHERKIVVEAAPTLTFEPSTGRWITTPKE